MWTCNEFMTCLSTITYSAGPVGGSLRSVDEEEVCVCLCVCLHMGVYVHIYICMFVYGGVCDCIHMSVCVYI